MSGDYSSAQEELSESDKHDHDMLVVDDDPAAANDIHSACESVEFSDDDHVPKKEGENETANNASLQEIRQLAYHKPSLSLTMVTEDADGNVTVQTENYEDDKHVTLILENDDGEGEGNEVVQDEEETKSSKAKAPSFNTVPEKDEDSVEEDLEEALKDMKIMSSLVQGDKWKGGKKRTESMQRRMGIITTASESDEDDDFISKMALMPIKSDETPVLTVPAFLADEELTDVEQIDE